MSQTLEIKEETGIVEFNEIEGKLANFKKKYDGVVYDLSDVEQDKQARSDKLTIGKVIASLDRMHRDIKAPLKERTDLIDHERKRIKDDLLIVQGNIKGQIEAHEQKIADHAEMLGNKVQAIVDMAEFGEFERPSSAQLKQRLASLKGINIDDSYEFRKADATLAEVDAVKKLSTMLADAMKLEAEQVELERLRAEKVEREQADRDARVKAEAEENARIQAEATAQREVAAAQQAQRAAEQQASEAEARENQLALEADREKMKAVEDERKRIDQAQREADAQAEKEAAEIEAKKENQGHRARIHKEAKESLAAAGFSNGVDIVTAIKEGRIKHVEIKY